jgi:hypothetical protein
MLVLPQTIQIKWTYKNKSHYQQKGYIFTKYNDIFEVNVLDLQHKSHKKVMVICDYCLEKLYKKYCCYNRQRKIIQKDACKNCQHLKRRDVFIKKYGVENPSYLQDVIEKIVKEKRTPICKVRDDFRKQGYILLSETYRNNTKPLKFICINHQSLGEQYATYKSVSEQRLVCKGCLAEQRSLNMSKDNNPIWKGGTRNLNSHIRGHLTEWSKQSFANCKGRCIISGESDPKKLTVHHLYSLNAIIEEALNILNFNWNENIGDYTLDELKLIEEMVLILHNKYPLGVVIEKTFHYEFHSIYGNGNNTPEQFREYLKKYHNIHSINLDFPKPIQKFFPLKKNRSSKYYGVCFVKKQSKNPYLAQIKHKGKTIYIGSFKTEIEAAYFFNIKAKEIRGEHALINFLSQEEIQFVEEKIKNGEYESKKGTKYKNITKRGNRWEASCSYNGKYYYIGSYGSDKEAALAYNEFVIKNNIKKPLNIIDD